MASKIRKFLDIQGLLKLIRLVKNNEQPHWIGTQAEYDSQKANIPNGAIVALTDEEDTTYDHGKYALVETVTGKRWIDGKPIYRKTFEIPLGTVTSSAWVTKWTQTGVVNIGMITSFEGSIGFSQGRIPINFAYNPDYNNNVMVWYIDTRDTTHPNTVAIRAGGNIYNNQTAYITIEYTKTTD